MRYTRTAVEETGKEIGRQATWTFNNHHCSLSPPHVQVEANC